MSDAIRKVGPLIALGRQGEAMGAGRIATDDAKWQTDIRVLMDRARAILCVPSDRPGTMWEMDTLKTANLLHKVIFIMPPRSKGDLDTKERWELARQALIGHGLEPPPYDNRGLLFEVGPDGRICNIEPMLLTSPRQVRKSLQRLLSYDGSTGGFLKAAARAERRARRNVVSGWTRTAQLYSPYVVALFGLFLTRPDVGFNPAESWSTVMSRSESAKLQSEYDDSSELAASAKYQALAAQVPANQRDAWRVHLVTGGLMRVSDEQVRGYFNAFGQMLSLVDVKTCASFVSGNIQPSARDIAMTYMPPEHMRQFLRARTAAMLAEAEALPVHAIDPVAMAAADAQFQAHLGADGQRRYQRIDQGQDPMNEENQCWLGRAIFSAVATLPEPHASVWARSLAAPGAAPPDPAPAPAPLPAPAPRPAPAPAPPQVVDPAPVQKRQDAPPRNDPKPAAPGTTTRTPAAPPQPQPMPTSAPAPVTPPPATVETPAATPARPSYPQLLDEAVSAFRAQRLNETSALIDQLIRLDPARHEAWSLRGLLAIDAAGDLATARESYENALARGGTVAFRVVHDHGSAQQFCVGNFFISAGGIEFTPETGSHRLQSPMGAIKEAAINGVYGSQVGMFHLKVDLADGTKNFNFAAARPSDQRIVNRKPDAELLLRLINERRPH